MKVIYIITKNADFTEGRGPMVFHSAWEDGESAVNYVKSQRGIYGSPQKIDYNKYGKFVSANGFDIDEVRLFNSEDDFVAVENERKRKTALSKLSAEDKKILGLE